MNAIRPLGCALALLGFLAAPSALPAAPYALNVTLAPPLLERLDKSLGTEEGPVLQRIVSEAITRAVTPDRCPDMARIDITVAEATPTHPTRHQLLEQPGLDFLRSVSVGGAALRAQVFAADGRVIDTVNFSRYPPTIQWASQAAETWSDARRAIDLFAAKLAADCGRAPKPAPATH